MALSGDRETFHGHQNASFTLSAVTSDVFLDFKGRSVASVTINGSRVPSKHQVFHEHRIQLPAEFLKVGANNVQVAYEAEYVTDCEGMQLFKDSADGTVYLYANSEPAHAHIWFPCFDQPDLKAPYELVVLAPSDWTVVSTARVRNAMPAAAKSEDASATQKSFGVTDSMVQSYGDKSFSVYQFDKSAKISTYLYCIVAGPYAVFEPSAAMVDAKIPMKLYCRQSIKKFVAEISEDWFRVTKNGIHYYEKIFSTPYPFDKFD